MVRQQINKHNEMIDGMKKLWEDDRSKEMTNAYNKIVNILSKLDMYSANILINLIWLQAVQKTYLGTVGKKEEVKTDG